MPPCALGWQRTVPIRGNHNTLPTCHPIQWQPACLSLAGLPPKISPAFWVYIGTKVHQKLNCKWRHVAHLRLRLRQSISYTLSTRKGEVDTGQSSIRYPSMRCLSVGCLSAKYLSSISYYDGPLHLTQRVCVPLRYVVSLYTLIHPVKLVAVALPLLGL